LKKNSKPKLKLGNGKKPKLKPTTNLLKVNKCFNTMDSIVVRW
jgi:hypothetical protein